MLQAQPTKTTAYKLQPKSKDIHKTNKLQIASTPYKEGGASQRHPKTHTKVTLTVCRKIQYRYARRVVIINRDLRNATTPETFWFGFPY